MAEYKITGTLINGKRFRPIFTTQPWNYNIYKGTIWKKIDGKWKKFKEITN